MPTTKGSAAGQDHAAGINAEATDPFLEVVAVSLEYKPLISEEGEGDAKQIGEEAGHDISVGKERAQEKCEQCKAAVAEDRVASAHG